MLFVNNTGPAGIPAGFQKSSGSGRNHNWFRPEQNSLKNSIVSKLFHKLIQLTKTISDYGEEIKVFRQFQEEVCFFFLHICFRIRRTAFLNKQMTEVMSEISSQLFSENVNVG